MRGSWRSTSRRPEGRSAETMIGQRIETSFQGCSSHRSGGSFAARRWRRLRGGKRGSAHALHQQREEHLRVEPGRDRIVEVVRQAVEAAERLPAFEEQLDLPAEPVELEAELIVEAILRNGREEHDVRGDLAIEVRDLRAV